MRTRISQALHFLQWNGDYRVLTSPWRSLPDFVIIGTMKGGTTSLYKYLTQHPHILSARKKEVHFFDKSYQFNRGIRWYKSYFSLQKLASEQLITGEASPSYMFYPQVPYRLFNVLPHVKLIAILRNPVDRAYSHYQRNVFRGYETLSFEDAIAQEEQRLEGEKDKIIANPNYESRVYRLYSYLARGRYIEQLESWFQYFTSHQLLIIKSEDLFTHPSQQLNKVFDFLEIPSVTIQDISPSLVGEYKKSTKKTKINQETRNHLHNYFQPYNQKLYKFINREFSW
jgi:hypothetical protein